MTLLTNEERHWSTTYAYHDAELKSALQKYVRRGMSEMAVACGVEMLRRGNALFRRLPTIAVEDCDPSWGGLVFDLCKRMNWSREEGSDIRPGVCQLLRALARAPKDKTAGGLAGIAELLNQRDGSPVDARLDFLQLAVQSRRFEDAQRIVDVLCKQGHVKAVWQRLCVMASVLDNRRMAEVNDLRSRASKGLMDGDQAVYLAGAILTMGQPGPLRELDCANENAELPSQPPVIHWFCLDSHTLVGKAALASLVKQGLDYEKLLWTAWYAESARVNRSIGILYQQERELRGYRDAETTWKEWRPVVKNAVEQIMRQRGMPTPLEEAD